MRFRSLLAIEIIYDLFTMHAQLFHIFLLSCLSPVISWPLELLHPPNFLSSILSSHHTIFHAEIITIKTLDKIYLFKAVHFLLCLLEYFLYFIPTRHYSVVYSTWNLLVSRHSQFTQNEYPRYTFFLSLNDFSLCLHADNPRKTCFSTKPFRDFSPAFTFLPHTDAFIS